MSRNLFPIKPHIALMVLVFLPGFVSAQVESMEVSGKVTDALTGKGVKSTIRYRSIPTGGISGTFYDSIYSFSVFGDAKYHITVEADGYNLGTAIVDPKSMGQSKNFLRDIRLNPASETIRLNHLIFAQGKSVIDPRSFNELDEVVEMMRANTSMIIQLEGHTDNVGNAQANVKLSEARVENVKKYIVSKGIKKDRIKTKAFGGSQPLSTEKSDEARALNRRVEMRILKN